MCTATDNVVKQDNLSHAVISVANGVLRDIWREIWQQLAMAEFIRCIETVITTHRKKFGFINEDFLRGFVEIC